MACELPPQSHLVEIPIPRKKDDLLRPAALHVEKRRDDTTARRTAIDSVAAKDERRSIRHTQTVAFERYERISLAESGELVPAAFNVGEVGDHVEEIFAWAFAPHRPIDSGE